MEISPILELLIAMALIYFLFSTLVSLVFEWYAYKTQKRGRFLYESVLCLLNDSINQSYGATLYSHYSIDKLKKNKESYPQYISAGMFADALIDIIGTQSETIRFDKIFEPGTKNLKEVTLIEERISDPFLRFKKGVDSMKYSPFKSQLRALYEKSNDYPELQKKIADWFDDYMQRVTGWYKVRTKRSLFYISLLVCLVFNVDSITLIEKIHSDDNLRKNLVIQAENKVRNEELKAAAGTSTKTDEAKINDASLTRIDSIVGEIENNAIPIGYQHDFKEKNCDSYYLMWICGILISAFALSFGAPFWFDVMVKAINIRRAGIKPS